MQYWFYSAEVFEKNELICSVSGIYPDKNAHFMGPIKVDLNDGHAVMGAIMDRLSKNVDSKVHFKAFNKI